VCADRLAKKRTARASNISICIINPAPITCESPLRQSAVRKTTAVGLSQPEILELKGWGATLLSSRVEQRGVYSALCRITQYLYDKMFGTTLGLHNLQPDDFHDLTTCNRSKNSILHCKFSFYIDYYPSRAPVFSSDQGFGHFQLYSRSENPGLDFSGRTFCQLAPQNDDYLSAILIIVFFGVPNPLIARKDRGSARVVQVVKVVRS
jgi:hypothetical protein